MPIHVFEFLLQMQNEIQDSLTTPGIELMKRNIGTFRIRVSKFDVQLQMGNSQFGAYYVDPNVAYTRRNQRPVGDRPFEPLSPECYDLIRRYAGPPPPPRLHFADSLNCEIPDSNSSAGRGIHFNPCYDSSFPNNNYDTMAFNCPPLPGFQTGAAASASDNVNRNILSDSGPGALGSNEKDASGPRLDRVAGGSPRVTGAAAGPTGPFAGNDQRRRNDVPVAAVRPFQSLPSVVGAGNPQGSLKKAPFNKFPMEVNPQDQLHMQAMNEGKYSPSLRQGLTNVQYAQPQSQPQSQPQMKSVPSLPPEYSKPAANFGYGPVKHNDNVIPYGGAQTQENLPAYTRLSPSHDVEPRGLSASIQPQPQAEEKSIGVAGPFRPQPQQWQQAGNAEAEELPKQSRPTAIATLMAPSSSVGGKLFNETRASTPTSSGPASAPNVPVNQYDITAPTMFAGVTESARGQGAPASSSLSVSRAAASFKQQPEAIPRPSSQANVQTPTTAAAQIPVTVPAQSPPLAPALSDVTPTRKESTGFMVPSALPEGAGAEGRKLAPAQMRPSAATGESSLPVPQRWGQPPEEGASGPGLEPATMPVPGSQPGGSNADGASASPGRPDAENPQVFAAGTPAKPAEPDLKSPVEYSPIISKIAAGIVKSMAKVKAGPLKSPNADTSKGPSSGDGISPGTVGPGPQSSTTIAPLGRAPTPAHSQSQVSVVGGTGRTGPSPSPDAGGNTQYQLHDQEMNGSKYNPSQVPTNFQNVSTAPSSSLPTPGTPTSLQEPETIPRAQTLITTVPQSPVSVPSDVPGFIAPSAAPEEAEAEVAARAGAEGRKLSPLPLPMRPSTAAGESLPAVPTLFSRPQPHDEVSWPEPTTSPPVLGSQPGADAGGSNAEGSSSVAGKPGAVESQPVGASASAKLVEPGLKSPVEYSPIFNKIAAETVNQVAEAQAELTELSGAPNAGTDTTAVQPSSGAAGIPPGTVSSGSGSEKKPESTSTSPPAKQKLKSSGSGSGTSIKRTPSTTPDPKAKDQTTASSPSDEKPERKPSTTPSHAIAPLGRAPARSLSQVWIAEGTGPGHEASDKNAPPWKPSKNKNLSSRTLSIVDFMKLYNEASSQFVQQQKKKTIQDKGTGFGACTGRKPSKTRLTAVEPELALSRTSSKTIIRNRTFSGKPKPQLRKSLSQMKVRTSPRRPSVTPYGNEFPSGIITKKGKVVPTASLISSKDIPRVKAPVEKRFTFDSHGNLIRNNKVIVPTWKLPKEQRIIGRKPSTTSANGNISKPRSSSPKLMSAVPGRIPSPSLLKAASKFSASSAKTNRKNPFRKKSSATNLPKLKFSPSPPTKNTVPSKFGARKGLSFDLPTLKQSASCIPSASTSKPQIQKAQRSLSLKCKKSKSLVDLRMHMDKCKPVSENWKKKGTDDWMKNLADERLSAAPTSPPRSRTTNLHQYLLLGENATTPFAPYCEDSSSSPQEDSSPACVVLPPDVAATFAPQPDALCLLKSQLDTYLEAYTAAMRETRQELDRERCPVSVSQVQHLARRTSEFDLMVVGTTPGTSTRARCPFVLPASAAACEISRRSFSDLQELCGGASETCEAGSSSSVCPRMPPTNVCHRVCPQLCPTQPQHQCTLQPPQQQCPLQSQPQSPSKCPENS